MPNFTDYIGAPVCGQLTMKGADGKLHPMQLDGSQVACNHVPLCEFLGILNTRINAKAGAISMDVHCTDVVTPGSREPYSNYYALAVLYEGDPIASGYVNGGSTISGIIISDPSMVQSFALSAQASSGSDGANDYVLNASLTDLIAAGSDGLRFPLTQFQRFSGIPYDTPIWVSCEAGTGTNEYTFNIMTGVEERTDTALTADLISGETHIDLKPLIGKIGGTVSERYTFEDRHIVYNCDIDVCGFNIDGNHEGPLNAVDVAYLDIMVPDGGEVYLLVGDPDDSYNTVLTTFEEVPVPIDRIATETGLRLYNFDFSDYDGSAGPSNYFLFATVVDAEYPNAELGSDEHIYRFTLKKAVEIKQILCLEPSCDPCIDLSSALADTVRSVAPSFACVSRYSNRVYGYFYFYNSGGSSSGSQGFQAIFGTQGTVYSSDAAYEVAFTLPLRDDSIICDYRSSRFNRADLSTGSLIPVDRIGSYESSSRFPAQVFLEIVSITSSKITYTLRDPDVLDPQLTLTTVMTDGDESTETLDMSCITDIVDDKLGDLSPVATSGSFNDLTDTPTNHVTTDTDQEIIGVKTFVGQKKIAFKQSAAADKLGFTLFDRNGDEVGYLEYNPSSSGKVNNTPVMTLGNYATKAAERSYVGFRRYSSISGASGAYNLLTPLIVDARTPFNLTTTYTNFYLLLGVSDGTNMYTVGSDGVLDLSAMIPTGMAHLAGAETFTGSKTFGAGVYGNVIAMSAGAIDVSAGTVFTKTITANTTISFTNVPAAPATACVTLILTNGGSKTVTWPLSVKWSGGSAPDLTASGVDVLTFLTIDGGTTWYGTVNSLGAA